MCIYMVLSGEIVRTDCSGTACGVDERTYCSNNECVAHRVFDGLPPYSTRLKCTPELCPFYVEETLAEVG
jgi:hypothetical protein